MWVLPTQFITAGQWWSKWSIHALHCLQNCDRCGCTYNKSPISNQSIAYILTLQDRNSTKLKQKLEYTKLFNLKTTINTLMREGRTSTPQNLFSIQTKKAIQVPVFTSQKLTQIVHCRSVKIITMNFLKNGIQIKIRGGDILVMFHPQCCYHCCGILHCPCLETEVECLLADIPHHWSPHPWPLLSSYLSSRNSCQTQWLPPNKKPHILGERASTDAKSSSQFSCSKAENNRAHTWHKSAVVIQFLSEIINTRMFQILAQKKTNHFVWQMKSLLTKEPLACLTWNGPCHSHMTTAGYVGGGLGTPIWISNLCLLQIWMCDLELARITHYHPAFATTHRES